jgi:hypothetical protein
LTDQTILVLSIEEIEAVTDHYHQVEIEEAIEAEDHPADLVDQVDLEEQVDQANQVNRITWKYGSRLTTT